MSDEDIKTIDHLLEGSGGGGGKGGGGDVQTPVEAPNDLHSKAIVKAIDMLGEGPIYGFVEAIDAGYTDPDSSNYLSEAPKSIYFNNVPVKSEAGTPNFGGVTLSIEHGTPPDAAEPIEGFSNVESAYSVGSQVTKAGGGVVRTVSDADVDRVRVTLQIPTLQNINSETGDINKTSVQYAIDIRPNGGNWVNVVNQTKYGKCTAPYAWSKVFRIRDYVADGTEPWDVRVRRITADSDSSYLLNDIYWSSYDEIKDEKLTYPDTAAVGVQLDAQYFGQQVPTRAYHIYGLKVQVPSNRYYTPPASTPDEDYYKDGIVTYSGTWNGTFKTEWTDNPAWIYYDLLTNTRYGLGLDEDYIDKWSLYHAGVYSDQQVTFSGVIGDVPAERSERRFTFNYRIENRQEAYHILNYVASCFHAMPFWSTGMATVSQDRDDDATRLFTRANVIGGDFEYSGTAHKARHTVAYITWNDPSDYYTPKVEVVEDFEGIERYGYQIKEVQAYGCTSRSQAQRLGKYLLYTDLNQTQTVQFRGGWEVTDMRPGEIIKIQDPWYSNIRNGGRVVSATSGTITLDDEVEIEFGEDYTIYCTSTSGTIMERDITTSSGTYSTVDVDPDWTEVPEAGSVWMITASNLADREFKVVGVVEEDPNEFMVTAIEHSSGKFLEVEQGVQYDPPPTQRTTTGALEPPTNLAGEEYTYKEGASNQQFGYLLSWQHADDPRVYQYDVQARNNSEAEPYTPWGSTGDNWFDFRPVTSGNWDFRVRSVGLNKWSVWTSLVDVGILGDPDPLPNITGLQVEGGGSTFVGKDIFIEWDTVSGTTYRWKDYEVEVWDPTFTTQKRTVYVRNNKYHYGFDANQEDFGAAGSRTVGFKVYARDTYDKLSETAATLSANNPAPSAAGTPTLTQFFRGIKVDWESIAPSDRDMDYYKLYFDDVTPPTEVEGIYDKNTTTSYISGLDPDTTYYVKVEPYDRFGVGTSSSVASTAPLGNDDIDIEVELVNSIVMTDSEGTSASGLAPLYDFDTATSGVIYNGATEKWIQYQFGIEDYIDRVTLWCDDPITYYFALSSDGSSWTYYNESETEGTLQTVASGSASSYPIYNPATKATWRFPDRQTAEYCRMYFTPVSGTCSIDELRFARMILGENVVADQLDAISANLGTINAGIIHSGNWSTTSGIFLDLNNEIVRFGGNDNPELEWNGNNTVLSLSGDSKIVLEEGGQLIAGDGNILIDSNDFGGVDGRIIVADNGTIDQYGNVSGTGNYLKIESGEVETYQYINGEHRKFKALQKIQTGVAANNATVNLGYFPSEPIIHLSPANLQTYDHEYREQSQSFRMEVQDLEQLPNYTWQFKPVAQLVLTEGGGTQAVGDTKTNTSDGTQTDVPASAISTPANTIAITVHFQYRTYKGAGYLNKYHYKNFYWRAVIDGNPTDWYLENPGADIGWRTVERTFSGLSNTTHTIYLQFYGQGGAGTFYTTGKPTYEYTWASNLWNPGVSVSASAPAGSYSSVTNYSAAMNFASNIAMPTSYNPGDGWLPTATQQTIIRVYYSYSLVATQGSKRSRGYWSQSDLAGYTSCTDCNGNPQANYICYCNSFSNKSNSGYIYVTFPGNYNQANQKLTAYAYSFTTQAGSAYTYLSCTHVEKKRQFYREVPSTVGQYNSMNFEHFGYQLGDFQVLAEGTINYLAIDGGT